MSAMSVGLHKIVVRHYAGRWQKRKAVLWGRDRVSNTQHASRQVAVLLYYRVV